MSDRIDVAFGAKLNELKKGTAQVKAEIRDIGKVAKEQRNSISSLANATKGWLAGTLSVGAAMASITRSLERASNIQDISERLGLSPEFLQQLDRYARGTGTSIDTLSRGVSRFYKELSNAKDGSDFMRSLEEIGLRVDDLRAKAPDQMFIDVARAIGAIEDPAQRAAYAQTLLSKSGTELIPLMRDIEEVLADTNVMSAEQIANLDAVGDAWTELAVDIDKAIGSILSEGPAGGFVRLINEFRVLVAEIEAGVEKSKIQIDQFKRAFEQLSQGNFEEAWDLTKPSEAEKEVDRKLAERIKKIRETQPRKRPKMPDEDGGGGSGGDSGGASGGSGNGSASKADNSLTPEEKAYREFAEANMKGGRLSDPGRAGVMRRRADQSRERADRANRRLGGPARQNRNNRPSATNHAQNEYGFYGGSGGPDGPGMSKEEKEPFPAFNKATKRAQEKGFFKNDPNKQAEREQMAKDSLEAAKKEAQDAGNSTSPGATRESDLSAMRAAVERIEKHVAKIEPKIPEGTT